MSLPPGTRLGVYEVTRQIGAGGMGEVYRATDSNLKRSVALKVLPIAVAGDAERLARFQREAEVLAALNHLNIAAVYGLEKTPDVTALVMELVEGEDLSQQIARGAIPLDEALPIAKQIAEALEAAHEQGIVHRDLKPANIKVRPDGTVKVLDFGLAKALDTGPAAGGGGEALANSPTITSPAMTERGVILGTAAYMAPEQAKGKRVDKRADIWAFGVVLYEMLTGRRLFDADNTSETLAAVLTRDVSLSALPETIPARLRALLRDCLIRDPKQRLRDIGDARRALDSIITSVPDEVVTPAAAGSHWARTVPWALAGMLGLALAAALVLPAARSPEQAPLLETRVDIVTNATIQPASFALSHDGQQIVFVASDKNVSRLWLRSLSTTSAQLLPATEGATSPFWSPDGHSIGFFAEGRLKRLDLAGGAPQALAPARNSAGGTWNADGVIVFAPTRASPLMRMPASGGEPTAVTTLGPGHRAHLYPRFLPDGRRVVFTVTGSAEASGIYLGVIDGSTPTRLTADATAGLYTPQGFLLWLRGGALMAQRLDVEKAALTGEAIKVADNVAFDQSTGSAISVASTGVVAYRTVGGGERQLAWFDRAGTARGIVLESDSDLRTPRVSPDGRRVAVYRFEQGNQDLWLLDGARASRFTFDPSRDLFPVWSPDGTRIVYQSMRTGAGALFHKLTSGAGAEEPLLTTSQSIGPNSWSADGRFLSFMSIDPVEDSDLWVLPMSGAEADRKPFVFLKTAFREAYGAFSPDGRWIAYHSNESGRNEVYVRPFVPPGAARPAAAGQWQVSTAGGIMAAWRADGKELYFLNSEGAMMAASISASGGSPNPGPPVVLFPTRIFGGGADIQQGRQYDVTRDGRFLINTIFNNTAAPITLVQNWHSAPTR